MLLWAHRYIHKHMPHSSTSQSHTNSIDKHLTHHPLSHLHFHLLQFQQPKSKKLIFQTPFCLLFIFSLLGCYLFDLKVQLQKGYLFIWFFFWILLVLASFGHELVIRYGLFGLHLLPIWRS